MNSKLLFKFLKVRLGRKKILVHIASAVSEKEA
jgi:hypothetical protein